MTRLALLTLVASVLAIAPSQTEARNIIGPDKRKVLVTAAENPYRMIGKFDNECSGTPVGKKLVLTASHCVINEKTGEVRKDLSYFRMGLVNSEFSYKAWVTDAWIGTYRPTKEDPDKEDPKKKVKNRRRDFAIVKLDRPIRPNWARLRIGEIVLDNGEIDFDEVTLAGFNLDIKKGHALSYHENCTIHERDAGLLYHDCGSGPGISGAPLLRMNKGQAEIIGIAVSEKRDGADSSQHVNYYSKDLANLAIPLDDIRPVIKSLKETEDLDKAAPQMEMVFKVHNGGPYATACRPYENDESKGFNPISVNDKVIADTLHLKRYANRSSEAKLAAERGGPAFGLTRQECRDTLGNQENGLICGAGLNYNVFRAKDGQILGGDEDGWSFKTFKECQQAITVSTEFFVCSWKGPDELGKYRIADGALMRTFKRGDRTRKEAFNYCMRHVGDNAEEDDANDAADDK